MEKSLVVLAILATFAAARHWPATQDEAAGGATGYQVITSLTDMASDCSGPEGCEYREGDDGLNDRPIIAILSQELEVSMTRIYGDRNYTSYIWATYVKFIEMAGARVVPVKINQPEEYYKTIFDSTNGLLIPGGNADIHHSGFERSALFFYQMALEAFDKRGDIYPIWGTCNGFEILAYFSNQKQKVLTPCKSQDIALSLDFAQGSEKTRIISQMPQKTRDILANEKVTINFHNFCLLPETFNNVSDSALRDFWTVISTNQDQFGKEFISMMESKKYPVWATQYHPEKNIFEFTVNDKEIPHFRNAVLASTYFSDFFVNQCRQSQHRFPDRFEEEKYLIYNYSPIFTGHSSVNVTNNPLTYFF